MSHEIFGERFIGARIPAWHKLGQVFTDAPTMTEALERAKITYAVSKIALVGGWTQPGGAVQILDSGQVAIVREPTADDPQPRILGTASKDYVVIQNSEIAAMLDPLSKEWPVETAGAIYNGGITFFTLAAGKFGVAGEECDQYLFVSLGHDGVRALNVGVTGTRIVCRNTLETGESGASISFRLRHVGNVKQDAEWYINLVGELRGNIKQAQERLQALGATQIKPEQAKAIVDAAYKLPKAPQKIRVTDGASSEAMTAELVKKLLEDTKSDHHKHAVELERMQELRVAGYQLYDKICDDFPAIAGTAWAAYNAVTELATWREGPTPDQSVLFGVRKQEITRAYQAASALIGK